MHMTSFLLKGKKSVLLTKIWFRDYFDNMEMKDKISLKGEIELQPLMVLLCLDKKDWPKARS